MELFLLRHGATPGNALGQYIGITDQPLSAEGAAQAASLRGHYPMPEALWVSPMLRARQTAELLFPGVEQRVVDTLYELDFGDWEEKTWAEVADEGVYDRWLSEDSRASFPGGECLEMLNLRTAAALRTIVEEAEGLGLRRGAVVAHGGVYMSIMFQFCRQKRENIFSWMSKNCGGFRVEVQREPLQLTLTEELAP